MIEKLEEKLTELSENFEDFAIVFTQVDPDAVGAALGLSFAIENLTGKSTEMYYGGSIGHPQNKALFNLHNLKSIIKPLKTMEVSVDCAYFLVDSCTVQDARLGELNGVFVPHVVVDHHRGEDLPEGTFRWIEEVGAVSTLIVELLDSLGLLNSSLPKEVMSSLALGIHTDTGALTSCTPRDLTAYSNIMRYLVGNELISLMNYRRPPSFFEHMKRALDNKERKGAILIADVGEVLLGEADNISTIADELMLMDGLSLVVVWGVVDGNVRLSIRNSDISNPLDDWITERFQGFGGSKMTPKGVAQGGANIPFEFGFWSKKAPKKAYELVKETLRNLTFGE